MTDKKISELGVITQGDLASGDWIAVVDSSENATKKYNFGDTKTDVTAFFNSTDTFTAGTIVRTDAEGFAYRATDTATATTVANAGGQNFEVLPGADGKMPALAFNLDNTADNTAAIQKALNTGHPIVRIPVGGPYDFTLLELNEGQILEGPGMFEPGLRIKDSAIASNNINDTRKRLGLSAKASGIDWCGVRDLQIDGNAANNRAWFGAVSLKNEVNCNNLNFGNNAVPAAGESNTTPPNNVFVESVYSHDAVRNCLNAVKFAKVIVNNCVFENSDFDHLIYISDGRCISSNVYLRGFWDGAAYVCQGNEITNVEVDNTVSHPLGEDGVLKVTGSTTIQGPVRIFECRDSNFDLGTMISNVFARQRPELSNTFAGVLARGVTISGVYLSFEDGAVDQTSYNLFGGSDIRELTVVGVSVQNAPYNLGLWEGAAGTTRELNDSSFQSVHVEYRASATTPTDLFISSDTAIKNTSFRDISFGDGVRRAVRLGTGDFKNVLFEGIHYKNSGSGNRFIELGVIGSSTYKNVVFRNVNADAASSFAYPPTYLFKWHNCSFGSFVSEKSGTFTASGDDSNSNFTLDDGTDLAGIVNHISVTPKTPDAAGPYWLKGDGSDPEVNAKIRYATAPVSGTDNVVVNWRIGWSDL